MKATLACLMILIPGLGACEKPPEDPLPSHLLVLRETSPALVGGLPMRLSFIITNASKEEVEISIPEDYLAGLQITEPGGKVIREAKESAVKEKKKLAARQSVERDIDIASILDVKDGKEGRYTFRWKFSGVESNPLTIYVTPDYIAVIETTLGSLTVEFFPDVAPRHVENFVALSRKGFYDGLIWHRLIKNFMIQGGCPNGDGSGGPGHTIPAEFNDRLHNRGSLSMARSQAPDSAGSQFFVCFSDLPQLDGQYTIFGKMIEGEATLMALEKVDTDHNPCKGCGAELPAQRTPHCGKRGHHLDRPVKELKIKNITIKVRKP